MPLERGEGVRVESAIVIRRTPAELFCLWRDLETLGRAFSHIDEVRCIAPGRSHWVARGPLGTHLAWDAQVINEVANERIGWESLPGGDVDCAGSVRFRPVDDGQATEVRVLLRYDPPAGRIGAAVAALLGADPARQIADDLTRLKAQVEAGAVPAKDVVQESSEESFPASDPPSWTAR